MAILARFNGTVQDTNGKVVPNAKIEVRQSLGTRSLVVLYADRMGTQTLGNPFPAAEDGQFFFNAVGGPYRVRAYTGDSLEPTFETFWDLVAVGNTQEFDVDQLGQYLSAGIAPFPTKTALDATTPTSGYTGAMVLDDPDVTKNGWYTYNETTEEWDKQRGFPDSVARLTVSGGTGDSIVATISSGTDPASILLYWLVPTQTNTGPVTINGVPLLTASGGALEEGWVQANSPIWFTLEGGSYRLAQDERWSYLANATIEARAKAREWATNAEDDPVETGEFSSLSWARKSQSYSIASGEAATQSQESRVASEAAQELSEEAALLALENATQLVIADQPTAVAGTSNVKGMSPLRTKQQTDSRLLGLLPTVEQFGAVGAASSKLVATTEDDTLGLQAAIDYSSQTGLAVALSSNRRYFASGLIWKTRAKLVGLGDSHLTPLPGTAPFITLDNGPIQDVLWENFTIRGLNEADRMCCYFQAKGAITGLAHGGLWASTFRRVTIRNFDGHNMWFRGGAIGTAANPAAAYDYLRPHQFIAMYDCDFERPSGGNGGHVLLMTGQVAQFLLTGRNRFDGKSSVVGDVSPLAGTNIVVSREFQNGSVFGGVTVGGAAVSDIAPTVIDFNGVTSQKAETAYHIDRATTVNIRGNYFENLYRAIRAETVSRVNINENRFANSGSDGVGGGYLVRAGSSAQVEGGGNEYTGAFDKLVSAGSARSISPTLFVSASADSASQTSGVTIDLSITAGAVSMIGRKSAIIYGSTTPLTTINSSLLTGELLAIKAQGDIILASGGNLTGVPNGRVVLRAGDGAVFQRHDVGGALILVGINRKLEFSAMPTSGYYEAGEEVRKVGFTPPTGNLYVTGWKRLTTGTAHVLGIDWRHVIETSGYKRATGVSTTPIAVFDLTSLFSTRPDAHLIVITGTDNSNGNRAFADLVLCCGLNSPVVVSSNNVTASSVAPAARTYSVSGNDLTLAMASGTYSVRASSLSVATGDVAYNTF